MIINDPGPDYQGPGLICFEDAGSSGIIALYESVSRDAA